MRKSIFKEDNSVYRGKLVDVRSSDYKVRVRIPSLYGGELDPNRVPDEKLSWYPSMYRFSSGDKGKVVYVSFVGGDRSNPIVLGIATEQDSRVETPSTNSFISLEQQSSVIATRSAKSLSNKLLINAKEIISVKPSGDSQSDITYRLDKDNIDTITVDYTVDQIIDKLKSAGNNLIS